MGLWDMENFYFNSTTFLLGQIGMLIRMSHHNMRVAEAHGGQDDPAVASDPDNAESIAECAKTVKFIAEGVPHLFAWLKCDHIDKSAERLSRWPSNPRWSELNTRCRALRDAIETELKAYVFYQYPKANGQVLKSWKADWRAALKAFPSIERDAFGATDCYALQHNTASIFHSMRVLEHGLAALAGEVGVSITTQSWQNVIDQIESRIRELGKGPNSPEKLERLRFLSEAAKEMVYFKDGWHNHVSHNRATYDEYQARGVLEHVRAFMTVLSERLSEVSLP